MASPPHASAFISAPAQCVWAVLTDLRSYPQWAPFTVQVEGSLQVGAQVVVAVEMTPGAALRRQPMTVLDASPPTRLSWEMTMLHPYLLHAEREQVLQPGSDGASCTYSTTDRMSGLLAPLVLALYAGSVAQGLQSFAAALKARAEALAAAAAASAAS
jgi:hypothetical protein